MTSSARLRMVRNLLLPGPIVLGLVVLWLRGTGMGFTTEADFIDALRFAVYGLLASDFVLLFVLRRLRARREPSRRGEMSLVGWAASTSGLLLAAMFVFMGGEPWPMGVGVFLVLISWSVLPADPMRL